MLTRCRHIYELPAVVQVEAFMQNGCSMVQSIPVVREAIQRKAKPVSVSEQPPARAKKPPLASGKPAAASAPAAMPENAGVVLCSEVYVAMMVLLCHTQRSQLLVQRCSSTTPIDTDAATDTRTVEAV